jgi:hypothetical protein
MIQFDSKIKGIPCIIEITSFGDYTNDNTFEVLNTKGSSAKWLEKKITKEDYDRIYNDMQTAIDNHDDY